MPTWRAVLLVLLATCAHATAQSPPAFDVASIRENRTLSIDGRFGLNPGRFTVANLPLRTIVQFAYDVRDYQVIGGPAWTSTTQYDVEAIYTDAGALQGEVRLMLQRLLVERFGLRVHREERELPMHALTLARTDARLGPRLTRSTVDCQQPPAGTRSCIAFATAWSERGFTRTMPQLAKALEGHLRQPVVDRTGLLWVFDYDLRGGTPTGSTDFLAGTVDDLAALPTALEEQLGLKLESFRAPRDVIVIDAAERPSPN